MKLSKKDLELLTLACSGHLRAADWKRFVPLSNKGLVDIDDDAGLLGHRSIRPTERGWAMVLPSDPPEEKR